MKIKCFHYPQSFTLVIDKRMYVKFNGSCLKQDKITFNHGNIVNTYIVYDLSHLLT